MFKNVMIVAEDSNITEDLVRYLAAVLDEPTFFVMGAADPYLKHYARTPMLEQDIVDVSIRAAEQTCTLLEAAGATCTSKVVKDEVEDIIHDHVAKHDFDLLAMVAHHNSTSDRMVLPDKLYEMLKVVSLPVLLIGGPVPPVRPKSVLVLTSEEDTQKILDVGADLVKYYGGSMTVFHIGDEDSFEYCEGIAVEVAGRKDIDCHFMAGSGSEDEILEMVDRHDILVASRGGRSLLDRLILSFSLLPVPGFEREIVKRSHTPVLLIEGD